MKGVDNLLDAMSQKSAQQSLGGLQGARQAAQKRREEIAAIVRDIQQARQVLDSIQSPYLRARLQEATDAIIRETIPYPPKRCRHCRGEFYPPTKRRQFCSDYCRAMSAYEAKKQ